MTWIPTEDFWRLFGVLPLSKPPLDLGVGAVIRCPNIGVRADLGSGAPSPVAIKPTGLNTLSVLD